MPILYLYFEKYLQIKNTLELRTLGCLDWLFTPLVSPLNPAIDPQIVTVLLFDEDERQSSEEKTENRTKDTRPNRASKKYF